ncbi:hypothetical protein ACVMIH_007780 [Bradyrhizobium sp. USDA 4503]
MNTTTTKIREDRLRRRLTKGGYTLAKTPARSWLRKHYGVGYMVLQSGHILLGWAGRQYTATLEEVEAFAMRR